MVSSLNSENIPNNIVFYDGYCVLCSRSIDFILSRDSLATFRFASLQSDFAEKILPEMGHPIANIQNLSNIVYLRHNDIKIKSDAILSILWDLGGIYKVSRLVYCLPRVVRDFCYDRLAKLRYRIFGKRNSCRVPTLQEKTRFLG
jgi:predicted DCC family thiol-disulfide oxidoreductase YuxK